MINQLFDQLQDIKNMQVADSNRDLNNFDNLRDRLNLLDQIKMEERL